MQVQFGENSQCNNYGEEFENINYETNVQRQNNRYINFIYESLQDV